MKVLKSPEITLASGFSYLISLLFLNYFLRKIVNSHIYKLAHNFRFWLLVLRSVSVSSKILDPFFAYFTLLDNTVNSSHNYYAQF